MIRIERAEIGPLRVAVAELPGLRSVTSVLAIDAGQLAEPHGRAGVARLTAQTMLRGTRGRSAAEWADALDGLGATARLAVGGQAAMFSGQCLVGDLAAYLGLVAETVLEPALDDAEIEFVRRQTLAQLEEESRDTRAVADAAWRELAYPVDHPFRRRPLGDERVVREAATEDIRRFHARHVIEGSALLVIVGGAGSATALDAARRAFERWPGGARRPGLAVPDTAIASMLRREVVVPDKTQCDVVLGWHGLARTDPGFVAARVTNMVYAADTFASRAGNVVRDQLGLAYYVHSTLGAAAVPAPWQLRMGVNPANVGRAVDTALGELRRIHEGDLSDDDLGLAVDKILGEREVALESASGVAQMVLEAELFRLGDDHFERYPEDVRAVGRDRVVDTARRLLPLDRYALAIAGPPLPA